MPPPPNPVTAASQSIGVQIKVSPQAQALLKRSCYDCHSNETKWPIYNRIWPGSMMIYSDVSMGRNAMNFSDWPSVDNPDEARHAAGLLMASCAAMESGLMPRKRYLILHPEAKISASEAKSYCVWANAAAKDLRTRR
ncbi:MAG TPA: heme-binding domain-containing protein [Bryobacteraceae bacterium]